MRVVLGRGALKHLLGAGLSGVGLLLRLYFKRPGEDARGMVKVKAQVVAGPSP